MPWDRRVAIKAKIPHQEVKMRKQHSEALMRFPHLAPTPPRTAQTAASSMTPKPKQICRKTEPVTLSGRCPSSALALLWNLPWLHRARGAIRVECARDELSFKACRTHSLDLKSKANLRVQSTLYGNHETVISAQPVRWVLLQEQMH